MGLFTVPVEYQGTYWETQILLLQTDCPFVELENGELVHYKCRYVEWADHLPSNDVLKDWEGECESVGSIGECQLAHALLQARRDARVHICALAASHLHLKKHHGYSVVVDGDTRAHWEICP
jgi:hypothetical protein